MKLPEDYQEFLVVLRRLDKSIYDLIQAKRY